jgi:hypothetical protein
MDLNQSKGYVDLINSFIRILESANARNVDEKGKFLLRICAGTIFIYFVHQNDILVLAGNWIVAVRSNWTHRNIASATSAKKQSRFWLKECVRKYLFGLTLLFYLHRSCYKKTKYRQNKTDKSKHRTCVECQQKKPHEAQGMCQLVELE